VDAVTAGIPDDVYWELTFEELGEVFKKVMARRRAEARAADLRAGLIAATIVNMFSKKGTRTFHPQDFVRGEPQYMSNKQARAALGSWAGVINSKKRGLKVPREDNA
jgi:hypothetical protein